MKKRIVIALAVALLLGLSVSAGLPDFSEAASWGYIEGLVFADVNWNGMIDPGEGGIHDVRVRISAGGWSAFTTTDWDGTFGFAALNTGRYSLEAILPDTHLPTTPVIIYKDITVGDKSALVVGADFGLTAVAGLADSGPLPFEGSVPGAEFWVIGECDYDPTDPDFTGVPCFEFGVDGMIIATHLGKGTYTAEAAIDYATGWWDPDVPTAICGEVVPGSTFAFVAANGDRLDGSLTGWGCQDLLAGGGWGTFQGEFADGTGRFEGAEGTVVKEFTGHNGVVASSWEGWIGY